MGHLRRAVTRNTLRNHIVGDELVTDMIKGYLHGESEPSSTIVILIEQRVRVDRSNIITLYTSTRHW